MEINIEGVYREIIVVIVAKEGCGESSTSHPDRNEVDGLPPAPSKGEQSTRKKQN